MLTRLPVILALALAALVPASIAHAAVTHHRAPHHHAAATHHRIMRCTVDDWGNTREYRGHWQICQPAGHGFAWQPLPGRQMAS